MQNIKATAAWIDTTLRYCLCGICTHAVKERNKKNSTQNANCQLSFESVVFMIVLSKYISNSFQHNTVKQT